MPMASPAALICLLAVCLRRAVGARPQQLEQAGRRADSDPCPHLTAAANNSEEYVGLLVPYRLVKTKHGLGLFVLRKVHVGEHVYTENDESKKHLTKDGWRRQLGELVLKKIWRADPELDKAYARLVKPGMTAEDIPTEMLAYILKRHWMLSYVPGDVFIEMNDSRFFNYAPLTRPASSLLQVREHDDDEEDNKRKAKESQGDPSDLMVAVREIEPCTELLEDYSEEDYVGQPHWFTQLRSRIGETSGFKDDSKTSLANVRSATAVDDDDH